MKNYLSAVFLTAVIAVPTYVNLYANETGLKETSVVIKGGFCNPKIYCGLTLHMKVVNKVTIQLEKDIQQGSELVYEFNPPYEAKVFSPTGIPIIRHMDLGISEKMLQVMEKITIDGAISQKRIFMRPGNLTQ